MAHYNFHFKNADSSKLESITLSGINIVFNPEISYKDFTDSKRILFKVTFEDGKSIIRYASKTLKNYLPYYLRTSINKALLKKNLPANNELQALLLSENLKINILAINLDPSKVNDLYFEAIKKYNTWEPEGYNKKPILSMQALRSGQISIIGLQRQQNYAKGRISKEVIQYDLSGKFLRVWPSKKEACRELRLPLKQGYDAIQRNVQGVKIKPYAHSYWVYKENFPDVPQKIDINKLKEQSFEYAEQSLINRADRQYRRAERARKASQANRAEDTSEEKD